MKINIFDYLYTATLVFVIYNYAHKQPEGAVYFTGLLTLYFLARNKQIKTDDTNK